MYEISIYPNTGHNYYFYPIMLEHSNKHSNYSEDVQNILTKYLAMEYNSDIVSSLKGFLNKSWIDGIPPYQYIKGHVEKRKIKIENNYFIVLGFNICIESNLGESKEGVFPIEFTKLAKEEIKKRYDDNETSYVDKNKVHLREKINQEYVQVIREDFNLPIEHDLLEEPKSFYIELKKVFPLLITKIENDSSEVLDLKMIINWKIEDANQEEEEVIDVNLIVDYGNSRTVVFALDMTEAPTKDLRDRCSPILLNDEYFDAKKQSLDNYDDSLNLESAIVNSWFTLTNLKFSSILTHEIIIKDEPFVGKKKWYHSLLFLNPKIEMKEGYSAIDKEAYMFTEVSPAELGNKAFNLAISAPIDEVGKYFLSSPKRYMWDIEPPILTERWSMLNRSQNSTVKIKKFKGRYSGFIPSKWEDPHVYESEEYDFDYNPAKEKFDSRPPLNRIYDTFPTCDAMIMNALAILEKSNRQIMSERYSYGKNLHPRLLTQITLLFPTGWTTLEFNKYRDAWRKARNIFLWSQYTTEKLNSLKSIGYKLNVKMEMNEAVSSALPIVFSEINHFGYELNEWISAFARKGKAKSVRVLTLDIGGGTQDISIIDYHNVAKQVGGSKIELGYNTIFSDSSRKAGDKLIQKLLEEVFFPYITSNLNSDELSRFLNLLYGGANRTTTVRNLRAIVNRLVFIPIIIDWLKKCNIDSYNSQRGTIETNLNECGISFTHLNIFNGWFRDLNIIKLEENDSINIDYNEINECIERWAKESIYDPILLFEGFECDLLIVSGKPSELRIVQEIIKDYFPIGSNDIIFVKNYYTGKWFPYTDEEIGRIKDAKLVTVMGGVLSQVLQKNIFPNWRPLSNMTTSDNTIKYFWGSYGHKKKEKKIFLTPKENECILEFFYDMDIGRFIFQGGNIQKIYTLKCVNKSVNIDEENPIEITLKRAEDRELIISKVSGKYQHNIKAKIDDFRLVVNPLESDKYWLDDPEFSINRFKGEHNV